MPFYDDDEEVASDVTTELGNGRSLTITLKPGAGGIPVARRAYHLYRQMNSVQTRIEKLQDEQIDKPAKYGELQLKIDELNELPDQFTMAARLLLSIGSGWDYYPDKAAEERGEPYEFNEENIFRFAKTKRGPFALMKVVDNVSKAVGLSDKGGDEDEVKKQPPNLPEQSTLAGSAPTSSPIGISS